MRFAYWQFGDSESKVQAEQADDFVHSLSVCEDDIPSPATDAHLKKQA